MDFCEDQNGELREDLGVGGLLLVPLQTLPLPKEWDIAFDFQRIPLGFPQYDASSPEAEGSMQGLIELASMSFPITHLAAVEMPTECIHSPSLTTVNQTRARIPLIT